MCEPPRSGDSGDAALLRRRAGRLARARRRCRPRRTLVGCSCRAGRARLLRRAAGRAARRPLLLLITSCERQRAHDSQSRQNRLHRRCHPVTSRLWGCRTGIIDTTRFAPRDKKGARRACSATKDGDTFKATRSHGTSSAIIISSYETPCAFRMGRITLPSAPQHLKGERRHVKWEIGLAPRRNIF
jgi:hypothetical protein